MIFYMYKNNKSFKTHSHSTLTVRVLFINI